MHSTSAFVLVLLALCLFLGLCQGAPRSKRTKARGKEGAHCLLTSDPGSCTSKYRRWYYDATTEDCKTFIWTGCHGNDNRFRSRGQCERSCKGGGVSVGDQSEDDVSVAKVKPTSVAKCRRLPCKGLRCLHGYEHSIGDNGCQTCQCRSLQVVTTAALPEVCPELDCAGKSCPRGMQLDRRGCPTCQCLGCPPLNCPPLLICRDGNVVDEDTGCERCECKTLPVAEKAIPASENLLPVSPTAKSCPDSPRCYMQCDKGFAVDAAGCELCACRDNAGGAPPSDGSLCRPVECNISCAGDYGKDENGCEICNCAGKGESKTDRKKNCPKTTACAAPCVLKVGKTECSVCACKNDDVIECDGSALITCSLYCPGGYDRDHRGCEICECRPLADEKAPEGFTTHVTCAPLNEMHCAEQCELFFLRFDENGCEVCQCVGDQSDFTTPSLDHECPALFECTLECPEALERDERGCEICMCRKLEVDERLKEAGTVGPEVNEDACPSSECPPPWCRVVIDGVCPRCQCDGPIEANATLQTDATCPEVRCDVTCIDDQTGCPSCACVDGSESVVTSDPFVTRDYELVLEGEVESEKPNPTPLVDWNESPTTLEAQVTDSADFEGSSTTVLGYPAEMMCSGRNCNKKCVNGLRRSEAEECFVCECNPEPRAAKRFVDVSIFIARKDICSLPAYEGPCHATLNRWHFNVQSGTCETFEYGGCRGYANNFRSKESCLEFCLSEVNQERATRQKRFKKVLGY